MEARSSRLKRIRHTKRVGLALVVAAVAAPSAQAYYPSEGLGVSAAPSQSAVIRGEDKAGLRGPVVSGAPVHGEDKSGIRDVVQVPVVAAPTQTVGFDWLDAGIGAAGAFALALLAASATIAMRRSRRSGLAAA
jgi:hypothetical protein